MKRMILMVLILMLVLSMAGCGDAHKNDLRLHLPFDEGKGLTVKDASGILTDVELEYQLAHAAYTDNQDPQWRKNGAEGGWLLFDGTT